MGAFDDDDNFDAEEFFKNFEEPTAEDMAEARKERDRIQNMPVMHKAKQIYELTKALTGVIDELHGTLRTAGRGSARAGAANQSFLATSFGASGSASYLGVMIWTPYSLNRS